MTCHRQHIFLNHPEKHKDHEGGLYYISSLQQLNVIPVTGLPSVESFNLKTWPAFKEGTNKERFQLGII